MAGLVTCLKKLGLSKHEAAILRGKASDLREDGMEANAAAVTAVREAMDRALAERADIGAQVKAKAGVEIPAAPDMADLQSAPKPTRSLFQTIKNLGGIKASLAVDLLGENAMLANRRSLGLFRKNGKNLDALIEGLNEAGWIHPNDLNSVDGGAAKLREMIRDEYTGGRAIKPGEADRFAEEDWARAQNEARLNDEEASMTLNEIDRAGLDATPETLIDAALVTRAEEINKDLVAALPDSMEPADFMRAIQAIVDSAPEGINGRKEPSGKAQAGGEGGRQEAGVGQEVTPVPERAAGGGREEPGLLGGYTEQDLRSRAERVKAEEAAKAKAEAAAEAKRKADAQAGELKLTGSDRAADANPDQGDLLGGTLQGGLPIKPLVDALQKAWGVSPKFARDWLGNMSDFFDSARETKAPLYRRIAAVGRMAIGAAELELRGLGKVHGSKAGYNKLADMLYEQAGKPRSERPAFEPERRRIFNQRMAKLDDALEGVTPEVEKQMVRQLDSGRTAIPASKKVADMLKEHGGYLQEHGALEDLVTDGYLPGVPDDVKILSDPKGFLPDATEALRMTGVDEPAKAAQAWLKAITLGESGMSKGAAEFSIPVVSGLPSALKHRVLSKSARAMLREKGWYRSDLRDLLSNYLWRTTSAAEMMRVLGKEGEHWEAVKKQILDEGGAAGFGDAVHIMSRVFGVRQATPGGFTRFTASANKLLTPFMLLGRATMSAAVETTMPAVRAGKPWLIPKAVADTIGVMRGKSASAQDKIQFGRLMGGLASALDNSVQMARMSADYGLGSKKAERLMSRYFFLNFLHPVTEASKAVAVDFGRVFINDHAMHVARKSKQVISSRHFLEELVPPSQVDAFAKWVSDIETGKVTLDKAMRDKAMVLTYHRALDKYNGEAILTPGRAMRPAWASTPQGAILFELTAFTQAFYKNVMARQGQLLKQQITKDPGPLWKTVLKGQFRKDLTLQDRAALLSPAVGVAMLLPLQYLQYEIRDLLFGDSQAKEKTVWSKLVRAVSGAGYLGALDRLVNIVTGVRYGTDPLTTAAGPFYGGVGRFGANAALLGIDAATTSKKETNLAERAMAKSVYDSIIQPAAVFALTSMPPGPVATPVAMAGIQAVSSRKTSEAFATAVAGEKAKKGGSQSTSGVYR